MIERTAQLSTFSAVSPMCSGPHRRGATMRPRRGLGGTCATRGARPTPRTLLALGARPPSVACPSIADRWSRRSQQMKTPRSDRRPRGTITVGLTSTAAGVTLSMRTPARNDVEAQSNLSRRSSAPSPTARDRSTWSGVLTGHGFEYALSGKPRDTRFTIVLALPAGRLGGTLSDGQGGMQADDRVRERHLPGG